MPRVPALGQMSRLLVLATLVVLSAAFPLSDNEVNSGCPLKFEQSTYKQYYGDVTTEMGCTCSGTCGASISDGFNRDWCRTASGCGQGVISKWDYCAYPTGSDYDKANASAKFATLSASIAADGTSQNWPSATVALTESMHYTFDGVRDLFTPGRVKAIHSIGTSAPVKFVSSGSHNYTGLFKGANHGFVRFSVAREIEDSPPNIKPGLGLKFLRDGMYSGNLVAMPSLSGQSDFNVGHFNWSNHVLRPVPIPLPLRALSQKFRQAQDCIGQVGLSDMAMFGESGQQETPNFPFSVDFVPQTVMQWPSGAYEIGRFQELAKAILPGSALFKVYAYHNVADYDNKRGVLMGTLVSTGSFATSLFGDQELFFQHWKIEDDLKLRPELVAQMNAAKGEDFYCALA